jgi:hypothetical protein
MLLASLTSCLAARATQLSEIHQVMAGVNNQGAACSGRDSWDLGQNWKGYSAVASDKGQWELIQRLYRSRSTQSLGWSLAIPEFEH